MSNQCGCGKEISPKAKRCNSCTRKKQWVRGNYDNRDSSGLVKAAWVRGAYEGNSAAMREARVSGAYGLEYHRRLSESLKVAHARGDYNGPETYRKQSERRRAAWIRGDYDGIFQSPTSIELAVAAALDICGVAHTSQFRPDGYGRIYDEFVPPDILIEINGTYWHGPQHPVNQRRDTEKAVWAKENGYYLVVIWEHEIKEQGAWSLVHERILPLLETRRKL